MWVSIVFCDDDSPDGSQ